MSGLNIQNPNEIIGKVVRIVCENNVLLEDIVCSIGQPKSNKMQLNLSTGQLTFEDPGE